MDEYSSVRISTGIAGLDEILYGGFIPCKTYLLSGFTGTGKTNFGNMFLYAGVQNGERVVYLTLQERESDLKENASKIGIDTSEFTYLNLSQTSDYQFETNKISSYAPPEDVSEQFTRQIIETVQKVKPSRIILDSVTQLRYMTPDPFQFRMRITGLFRYFIEHHITLLAISEKNSRLVSDDELKPVFDGVFSLEHSRWDRNIVVEKFRGSDFKEGAHAFRITNTGVKVFPHLLPRDSKLPFNPEIIPSGVNEIDRLVHGGIERGTITIFSGPSGVGKTTLGIQFMQSAAKNKLKSVCYSFEEETNTIIHRCNSIGIILDDVINDGYFSIRKIEPFQYTNDEFASVVRYDIEHNSTKIIMIDPIVGFETAYGKEGFAKNIHAISKFALKRGATVFIIVETMNIIENLKITEGGISYLSDNIIFLRYLEIRGEMRKAIGVLKKRLSDFEKTLREFKITNEGIKVGEPFVNLRGILIGTPEILKPEEDRKERLNAHEKNESQ